MGQVKISLDTQVTNIKNVDQLLNQMREINKLSSITIKTSSSDKQAKESLNRQKEKVTLIRLERELIKAQNKDWAKSMQYITKLNKQLQQGKDITRDQWAELKLINDQEQQRLTLLIRQEKVSQQIAKIKTSDMNKLHSEALKMNKVYNEQNKIQKKQTVTISKLATSYMELRGAMWAKAIIQDNITQLAKLDESMFNLGVVAGKTTSQIEKMKWELVELSTTFPQTATEIANAIDLVARTGLTFEDSMKTVKAGMILSTASGESLNSISQVLAKTLVAFSLSGEEASDAINTFYSAVLKTPLSLEGLSQSMRNSASSFATLIDFTNKSGEEFEDYKKDLLELQVALTAGFAKLGWLKKLGSTIKPRDMLEHLKAA